jgi:cell division protein FtsB
MPPARPATSAASANSARRARAPQPRQKPPARIFRPRSVGVSGPLSRIRWDRKFRTVMLLVLLLVCWLGVQALEDLLAAHSQAAQQQALVQSLARQNHRLEAEQQALTQPATIINDARSLGMVRSGERSYVVTGLSGSN